MTSSTAGIDGPDARIDLLHEIGRRVGSVPEVSSLIERITRMTEHTLGASAASLLLVDEAGQELIFKLALGEVGRSLEYTRISAHSGIAGWVARHGKPLIINDVSKDPRFFRGVDRTTGFVTESVMCVPLMANERCIGVLEVLNRVGGGDFDERDLGVLVSVARTAAAAIEGARLHEAVADGYRRTAAALAAAIDAKDPYTLGHSQRVTQYALIAGRALLLLPDELENIVYGGMLHDIGKIGVSDSILRKSGGLGPEEWAAMHRHPSIGSDIARDVPLLGRAGALILHHHERHDGKGYGEGLSGEAIPVGARLIAVADAFDTMTTDRAYRPRMTVDQAVKELRRCTGAQFCPIAVEAFLSGFERNGRNLIETTF
jgi:HD-GYP domain-containing protein (c-di-GMP phosphodiesterase class II)